MEELPAPNMADVKPVVIENAKVHEVTTTSAVVSWEGSLWRAAIVSWEDNNGEKGESARLTAPADGKISYTIDGLVADSLVNVYVQPFMEDESVVVDKLSVGPIKTLTLA